MRTSDQPNLVADVEEDLMTDERPDNDRLYAMIGNVLPEGAIPTEAILVIGYIDASGESCYYTMTGGSGQASNHLGLLELGKHQILHSVNPTPCEREERP